MPSHPGKTRSRRRVPRAFLQDFGIHLQQDFFLISPMVQFGNLAGVPFQMMDVARFQGPNGIRGPSRLLRN